MPYLDDMQSRYLSNCGVSRSNIFPKWPLTLAQEQGYILMSSVASSNWQMLASSSHPWTGYFSCGILGQIFFNLEEFPVLFSELPSDYQLKISGKGGMRRLGQGLPKSLTVFSCPSHWKLNPHTQRHFFISSIVWIRSFRFWGGR